jgi:hypothetical protein
MKKKEIKTKLYKLLSMYPEDLCLSDWKFIHKHLTYEIVNKYIDKTGNAVLLPGITTDEQRYWVNATEVLQYFNATERSSVE